MYPITDVTNKFVDILFSQANEYILTCSFLASQDATYRACSIMYGPQQQQLIWNATNSSTSPNVTLSLDDAKGQTVIYYSVNASNSTFTVIVEGSLRLSVKGKAMIAFEKATCVKLKISIGKYL